MVGPAGPTWRPLAPDFFRCLLESSLVRFVIFFMADKFHVYFALESLFLAFLKIDHGKYKIYKTHRSCQFKPTGVFSYFPLGLKF